MSARYFTFLISAAFAFAAPDGAALYKTRCAVCHDGAPQARMPAHDELAGKSPESIVNAMFRGAMRTQAAGLTAEEGAAIAKFLTGKEPGASTEPVAGVCKTAGKPVAIGAGDWNGWGGDSLNTHFQPNPGLAASDVPKLKLKWAFGYPKETSAWAQPTVVGGRIFVGSGSGTVYSLDAATGCVYWTYDAGAGVRSAISIGKLANGKWIAYFGDIKATAHAVDANTGAELWKIQLDTHAAARITGAPSLVNGRLYVPVSSLEEVAATAATYSCCTFRGSVAALDAATGKKIWQGYTVSDPAKTYKQHTHGVDMKGPAGASVWSSPTVDVKRKLVYAATGNSYTDVDISTSDAVLAFDLDTGRLVWASQVQAKDGFIVGCPTRSINCPEEQGHGLRFRIVSDFAIASKREAGADRGTESGRGVGTRPGCQGKDSVATALGTRQRAGRRRMGIRSRRPSGLRRDIRSQRARGRIARDLRARFRDRQQNLERACAEAR